MKRIAFVALLFSFLIVALIANVSAAIGGGPQAASTTSASVAKSPKTSETAKTAEPEEHGLSQKPDEITHFLNFPITNSMIVSWIVGVGLLIFAQLATRSMKPVPDQWLVEGLYKFIESIIGPHFDGADVLVLRDDFHFHSGRLKWPMLVVFFAAGCLEIVSILFRPVSLTFRLYGNIFAGENMLDTMAKLIPGLGWLLQIPFYFLELLMGLVQAMVFMLLTAVFTLLMCNQVEAAAPAHE